MPLKSVKITLIIILVAFLFSSTWFFFEFRTPQKSSSTEIVFQVNKGENASTIARNLKQSGLIKKKWAFLLGHRIFFSSKSLKAGEYSFPQPISTKNILDMITEGQVILHSITIPEGLTRLEIADLFHDLDFLDKKDFLTASDNPALISSLDTQATNLEGYLFPETYHFPKETGREDIVKTMVSQFHGVFNTEWKKRADELGFSVRKIVTLASLIEEETSIPEERHLISAVFHNRLKIGMKLDCDPTIIYALKLEGRFQDRLRTKDLRYDTPYNTYLYGGLPPGPIANPGKDSLKAALYPAEENYLYFVSKNDGSHHFSRTFREHQNAVNKYQKKRR